MLGFSKRYLGTSTHDFDLFYDSNIQLLYDIVLNPKMQTLETAADQLEYLISLKNQQYTQLAQALKDLADENQSTL